MSKEYSKEHIQSWVNNFEEIILAEKQCDKDKRQSCSDLLALSDKFDKNIAKISKDSAALPGAKELGCDKRIINTAQISSAVKDNKCAASVLQEYQKIISAQKKEVADKNAAGFEIIKSIKDLCDGKKEVISLLDELGEKYQEYYEVIQGPEQDEFADIINDWIKKAKSLDALLVAKSNEDCEKCFADIKFFTDDKKKDILKRIKEIYSFSESGGNTKKQTHTIVGVFKGYDLDKDGKRPFGKNPRRLKVAYKVSLPVGSVSTAVGLLCAAVSNGEVGPLVSGLLFLIPGVAVLGLGIYSKITFKKLRKEIEQMEKANGDLIALKGEIAEMFANVCKKALSGSPCQEQLVAIGKEIDDMKENLKTILKQWEEEEGMAFSKKFDNTLLAHDQELQAKKTRIWKDIPEEVKLIFERANELQYKGKDYRQAFVVEARQAEDAKGILDAYYRQEAIIKDEKYKDDQLALMAENNKILKAKAEEEKRIMEQQAAENRVIQMTTAAMLIANQKAANEEQMQFLERQDRDRQRRESEAKSKAWDSQCRFCVRYMNCSMKDTLTGSCAAFTPRD